jgi:hypothetical protein
VSTSEVRRADTFTRALRQVKTTRRLFARFVYFCAAVSVHAVPACFRRGVCRPLSHARTRSRHLPLPVWLSNANQPHAPPTTTTSRFAHSINSRPRLPPLGFYGGDSHAAVAAYIDILRYCYVALQRQLALLDPAFMMVCIARVCVCAVRTSVRARGCACVGSPRGLFGCVGEARARA